MKKLIISILMVLVMVTGCVSLAPPVTKNEPPIAYIDSISSTRIFKGETVSFKGHGIDGDGNVVAYLWRSSLDGVLSTSASFDISSLSAGKNTVYFKVQDNDGDWAKEVYRDITVIPVGAARPIVHSFEASPKSITKGESAMLVWNVSGAAMVSIEPDIGDVPSSGNRKVSPLTITVYTMKATNAAGSVIVDSKVMVNPVPAHTMETFSIVEESGSVRRDKKVSLDPNVGDTISGVTMQAFLSFDISMIPAGAVIESASLDLSHYMLYGNPFGALGGLGVFHHQYGDLSEQDYVSVFPGGAMVLAYVGPNQPYVSERITDAVQQQVDKKSSRFKVRLQFEKDLFYDRQADYLAFGLTKPGPKLIVKYKE